MHMYTQLILERVRHVKLIFMTRTILPRFEEWYYIMYLRDFISITGALHDSFGIVLLAVCHFPKSYFVCLLQKSTLAVTPIILITMSWQFISFFIEFSTVLWIQKLQAVCTLHGYSSIPVTNTLPRPHLLLAAAGASSKNFQFLPPWKVLDSRK